MSDPRSNPGRPTSGPPRPVVLCILDGWGDRDGGGDNAIAQGRTPNWDRYGTDEPRARLLASAEDVGLPVGQMGNSEVGHTNIGAGRIVPQDLPRIDAAIADGSLAANPVLAGFIEALRESGGTCHLLGLLSPGGVHCHQDHMAFLATQVAAHRVPVAVHALLDGRDVPPKSARGYMARFGEQVADAAGVSVATVGGRYFAMDRDKRWERVEKGYAAMALGDGEAADDPLAAIDAAYAAGVTDEFMIPAVIGGYGGMADGDGLLVANFRADRMRQILAVLADPDFDGFARPRVPALSARLGMVSYSSHLDAFYPALFGPLELEHILGGVVADAGLTQLRLAETEKYAHVTFFLNGGRERVFPGEERILVPSPRVATYDLQPEMSAPQVTDKLVAAIEGGGFDLIVVNYANGDMVGHTGIMEAAVLAVETVDTCLGRVEAAVRAAGGALLITADHGNCEAMSDAATGQPQTAHTLNRVPVILLNAEARGLRDGTLADVAPTVLDLLGLERPAEMTGRSLIERDGAAVAAAQ